MLFDCIVFIGGFKGFTTLQLVACERNLRVFVVISWAVLFEAMYLRCIWYKQFEVQLVKVFFWVFAGYREIS